jgi:hypothetical protein
MLLNAEVMIHNGLLTQIELYAIDSGTIKIYVSIHFDS